MSSSWFPASSKRPNVVLSNGDDHPLLPINGGRSLGEDEDDDQEIEQEMRRFATDDEHRSGWRGRLRRNWPVVAVLAVLGLLFAAVLKKSREPEDSKPLRGVFSCEKPWLCGLVSHWFARKLYAMASCPDTNLNFFKS
jgi:hypothetical protein